MKNKVEHLDTIDDAIMELESARNISDSTMARKDIADVIDRLYGLKAALEMTDD